MPSARRRITRHARRAKVWLRGAGTAAAAAVIASCGGSVTSPDAPAVVPSVVSHPGFDTSLYPGDAAMRSWSRPGSPYEWVGYYLPAPCHRDATWSGRQAALRGMGWGLAVLYVGQQTWEGVPQIGSDVRGVRVQASVVCSRTLLSAEQGAAEGSDAIARAVGEGFAAGTVIFLDLEPMSTIPPAMHAYYRSWVRRLLQDGRYRPGIYCHRKNAAELFAAVSEDWSAANIAGAPQFWIASTTGFALGRSPTDVGMPFAAAWQGLLDVSQAWSGVTLHIDVSVARERSPSVPSAP